MVRKAKERSTKKTTPQPGGGNPLYTLEVFLIGGPITEKFAKKNKVVSRTVQIRGDQTLEDFHDAIFRAFDRDEEHMYEFQIGGKRPMDRKACSYVLPMALNDLFSDRNPDEDAACTTIGSLGLKVRQAFFYWFDFGDDWWHQIKVVAIEDSAPRGRFPRVVQRVGDSPPQYIDWEEEEAE